MLNDDLRTAENGIPGEGPPVDIEKFRSRFNHNEEFQSKLVQIFIDDTPQAFAAMNQAMDSGDMKAAKKIAHTLANSCGVIQASRAVELSRKVEETIAKGENPSSLAIPLGDEIARIIAFLRGQFPLP